MTNDAERFCTCVLAIRVSSFVMLSIHIFEPLTKLVLRLFTKPPLATVGRMGCRGKSRSRQGGCVAFTETSSSQAQHIACFLAKLAWALPNSWAACQERLRHFTDLMGGEAALLPGVWPWVRGGSQSVGCPPSQPSFTQWPIHPWRAQADQPRPTFCGLYQYSHTSC